MDFLSFKNITFAHPIFFWLLLLVPLLIYWYAKKGNKEVGTFKVSSLSGVAHLPVSWKSRLRPLLWILRILALVFLIVALTRPRTSSVTENLNSEGIDIVLSIDISGSMLARDFKPDRMEAAKEVAAQFVKDRPGDRIGLVIFAGESFTQCPITTDHQVLLEQIKEIESGALEDGTAIGMGLATAVDRLRSTDGKSKVIILLTDGENNTGLIDPETALEIAKTQDVKVYTIGVGTIGKAPFPMPLPGGGTQIQEMDVQIDEDLLKKIATETGGAYFRATDNKSLEEIYDKIDQMEKTKVEVSSFKRYKEWFYPFAVLAIAFLFLEVILRYSLFKSLP